MSSQHFDRRGLLVGGVTLLGGCVAASKDGRSSDDVGYSVAKSAPKPAQAATSAKRNDERILVLVEMFGGNDGLNTIVPFTDDVYYKKRSKVNVAVNDVLKLDEHRGFHPSFANLRRYWDGGNMAIVQGVGYPKPVYSHFKSFEIWHTARPEGTVSGDGWIGRLRNTHWKNDPRAELVVHLGDSVPYSLHSSEHQVVAFATPERFVWAGDRLAEQAYAESANAMANATTKSGRAAVQEHLQKTLADAQKTSPRVLKSTLEYKTDVQYPDHAFGQSLRAIAGMIDSDFGGRVYSVRLGNFDTHAQQASPQATLLAQLDSGLSAFLKDVEGRSKSNDVLVMAYSEFGRRVAENYSSGTDHGAAGPAFFFGKPVKGGWYGKQPSLSELDQDENLVFNVDFRSLYATVLENWIGADSSLVLPAKYPTIPLLAV